MKLEVLTKDKEKNQHMFFQMEPLDKGPFVGLGAKSFFVVCFLRVVRETLKHHLLL